MPTAARSIAAFTDRPSAREDEVPYWQAPTSMRTTPSAGAWRLEEEMELERLDGLLLLVLLVALVGLGAFAVTMVQTWS